MDTLFVDVHGKSYTADDVYLRLKEIGADDCETLFIHSDVMFGGVVAGFNRKVYLSTLYEVVKSLGVKNIIVPTFTYSFCNRELYDVKKSRTSMGAFNEFVRKQENRYRTMDPLLSLSVPMDLKPLFENVSNHSLGVDSGLDIIHHMDGVKFLFFGARLGNCFTYVHYVEKMLEVPYRFDMGFSGAMVDEKGMQKEHTQYIHTACFGVKPADYYYFEDYLQEKNLLRKRSLGDKEIACISERDAFSEIKLMLEKDIHYFLEHPFEEKDLIHKYTMGLNGEKITHC